MGEPGTPAFVKGDPIEVRSDLPGFVGAWFQATVLRKFRKKKRLSVEYQDLLDDDDDFKPLRELVEVTDVRPRPPPPGGAPQEFAVGDKVEAFVNDGWWIGDVVGVLNGEKYVVKFADDGEESEVWKTELRTRLDWVNGQWVRPSLTNDDDDSPERAVGRALPFAKTSPLWGALESMEVFIRWPQNPHFRPLERVSEDAREGLAIGRMVCFVNLVESMRLSRFADPLSAFVERLGVVEDLKLHGFDIPGMHSRLVEMIGLKKIGEQCEKRIAELEGKIMSRQRNSTGSLNEKINTKTGKLEKLIAELHCKSCSLKEPLEICQAECARWQKDGKSIKERLFCLKQEFDSFVKAPVMNSCV